jgi:hypothetical protein
VDIDETKDKTHDLYKMTRIDTSKQVLLYDYTFRKTLCSGLDATSRCLQRFSESVHLNGEDTAYVLTFQT